MINDMNKIIPLNRKNPEASSPVWSANNTTGKPNEKQVIATSVDMNNVRQLFIRVIAAVATSAPPAAPAIKDATRIPIHEKT